MTVLLMTLPGVNGECHAGLARVRRTLEVKVELARIDLGKFPLEAGWVDTKVGKRAHQLIAPNRGITFDE